MNKIKIAIVDDSRDIRRSLGELLSKSPDVDVVMSCSDGKQFLDKIGNAEPSFMPEVVLMDVDMPTDGVTTVRQAHLLFPDVYFLMLTVFDDADILFEAMKAGASGYLLKDEKTSTIIDYIKRCALEGGAHMSPSIARKAMDILAARPKIDAVEKTEEYNLTLREKEVLSGLVKGWNYRLIADELGTSPHTTRKHISNIYKKLHVSSKIEAVLLAQNKKLLG